MIILKEKIVLSPYFSSICFLDLGNICGKLVESIGFKEKKYPQYKTNLPSFRYSEGI